MAHWNYYRCKPDVEFTNANGYDCHLTEDVGPFCASDGQLKKWGINKSDLIFLREGHEFKDTPDPFAFHGETASPAIHAEHEEVKKKEVEDMAPVVEGEDDEDPADQHALLTKIFGKSSLKEPEIEVSEEDTEHGENP